MIQKTQKPSSIITSAVKDQQHSTTSPLISYYMSELIPNYEDIISYNIKQLKFTEPVEEEEKDIGTQIESTIKKNHNFIIPAISLELNHTLSSINQTQIELQLANLKELFSLFGEIQFIDITPNVNKAYILYKYYFSALFAYETINQILHNRKVNGQVKIKLINEKNSKENPQKKDASLIAKLNLNTDCKAYIPKAYKNQLAIESKNNRETNSPHCCVNYGIQFSTFSSREYLFKHVSNYNIQIENESEFQVTKRIIGNNVSISDNMVNNRD